MQPPPPGLDTWEDWLRENDVPESEWNSISAVVDPDGVGPRLFFQRVPEPKDGKTRVHLDLNVGGGPGTPIEERRRAVDAAAERLVALGAERVQQLRGARRVLGRRCAIPQGTEFDLQ